MTEFVFRNALAVNAIKPAFCGNVHIHKPKSGSRNYLPVLHTSGLEAATSATSAAARVEQMFAGVAKFYR